jgi:hypothetical protein
MARTEVVLSPSSAAGDLRLADKELRPLMPRSAGAEAREVSNADDANTPPFSGEPFAGRRGRAARRPAVWDGTVLPACVLPRRAGVSFGLIHPGRPAEAATPERYSRGKKRITAAPASATSE